MNNYNKLLRIGSEIFVKDFALLTPNLTKEVNSEATDSETSLETIVLDYNIRYYSQKNATFVIEMDNIKPKLIDTIVNCLTAAIDNCLFHHINVEFDISLKESKEHVQNMMSKLLNNPIANNLCLQVNAYIKND